MRFWAIAEISLRWPYRGGMDYFGLGSKGVKQWVLISIMNRRELSQKVRTFARMMASLIEEAEAINWYEQRISIEKDSTARAIMKNAQKEEFKHFGMNLEFLLRQKKDWRIELEEILFSKGSIVRRGEAGEKKVD
jgi:uncharacterized protein